MAAGNYPQVAQLHTSVVLDEGERVLHVHPELAHRALDVGLTQEQQDRPQVAGGECTPATTRVRSPAYLFQSCHSGFGQEQRFCSAPMAVVWRNLAGSSKRTSLGDRSSLHMRRGFSLSCQ